MIELKKVHFLPSICKFHTNNTPGYVSDIFSNAECNEIPTCFSYQKFKFPHLKTNQGLKDLSYIGPSTSITSVSLNAFKRNLKGYYFRKAIKKSEK